MEKFRAMKESSKGLGGFLNELVHGLTSMPKSMRQLAVVQFFTWVALFCMWIYFSPAIARHVFGAVKDAENYSALVAEAGQWTGVCFSVYNGVCFVFSFGLIALARKFSARAIHVACLLLGAAGLASVALISDKQVLLVAMVGVGVAWASILSMPYAMLSNALPADKMGFYMGVFNFFIVLPQIAIALGLGKVLAHFPAVDSVYVVVSGGAALALAAALTLRVQSAEHPSVG
jgi:maltose/moltooligosaccharide transporter